MIAEVFFDTNIVVYAALGLERDEAKREIAFSLIEGGNFGTSTQVLQEFFVTATRKSAQPLSVEEATAWIDTLLTFPCQQVDSSLVMTAIERSKRYRISYWDGAIIAAAEALGCRTLYTEDLNDGQMYGSVRVKNPFR